MHYEAAQEQSLHFVDHASMKLPNQVRVGYGAADHDVERLSDVIGG